MSNVVTLVTLAIFSGLFLGGRLLLERTSLLTRRNLAICYVLSAMPLVIGLLIAAGSDLGALILVAAFFAVWVVGVAIFFWRGPAGHTE